MSVCKLPNTAPSIVFLSLSFEEFPQRIICSLLYIALEITSCQYTAVNGSQARLKLCSKVKSSGEPYVLWANCHASEVL